MYSALAQYRNQWVVIVTTEDGRTVLHGILEEVTRDYVRINVNRDDGRMTYFVRTDTIIRLCPDAPELKQTQLEAAYSLGDDDDQKELVKA